MVGLFLSHPKYAHNVGGAMRAAAIYGASYLFWSGDRISIDGGKKHNRLPREERMRGYQNDIEFGPSEKGLKVLIDLGMTPVAIEIREDFRSLVDFEHPQDAVYAFGPEDGSLSKSVMAACHHHVYVPTKTCMNLAATVNVVLYDRLAKEIRAGRQPGALREILRPYMELDHPLRAGFDGR